MPSWEFPGSEPIDLYISVPAGSIAISGEPTETTTVSLEPARRRGEDIVGLIQVEFNDGRLEITGPKHLGLRRGSGVDVVVKAPVRSRCTVSTAASDVTCLGELGALDVRGASGDVRAEVVSGPAEVRTASGDVWLEDVAAEAIVNTASGDIRLEHAGADVAVNTASGDLTLGAAGGSATVRTASGDVQIDRIATGDAVVTSVSGDITVAVAAGIGVYLNLSAVTGRISSQLDEAEDDGAAALTLKCRTVSGDITVGRAAPVAAG